MGHYDSLHISCVNCGTNIEFQSKAGECVLKGYDLSAMPFAVADDLDGQGKCCPGCGRLNVVSITERKTVEMKKELV